MKCRASIQKNAQEQTLSKCIVEEESLISYCAKLFIRARLLNCCSEFKNPLQKVSKSASCPHLVLWGNGGLHYHIKFPARQPCDMVTERPAWFGA
jgi:hypothetical protein